MENPRDVVEEARRLFAELPEPFGERFPKELRYTFSRLREDPSEVDAQMIRATARFSGLLIPRLSPSWSFRVNDGAKGKDGENSVSLHVQPHWASCRLSDLLHANVGLFQIHLPPRAEGAKSNAGLLWVPIVEKKLFTKPPGQSSYDEGIVDAIQEAKRRLKNAIGSKAYIHQTGVIEKGAIESGLRSPT